MSYDISIETSNTIRKKVIKIIYPLLNHELKLIQEYIKNKERSYFRPRCGEFVFKRYSYMALVAHRSDYPRAICIHKSAVYIIKEVMPMCVSDCLMFTICKSHLFLTVSFTRFL